MNPLRPQGLKKSHPHISNIFLKFKTEAEVARAAERDNELLRASYNISLLIARTNKQITIGEELILPAILKIPFVPPTALRVNLSKNSVQRKINEMAENIEKSLCNHLKTCKFSIQLDVSTLPTNETLLLSYVRFIKDEKIYQELLFAKSLKTDIKGETIFNTLKKFCYEKEIPLNNIISVATDGASAMTGCHKDFIRHLKIKLPDVIAVHNVIHRQHLVAKKLSERLFQTLQYIIKAVNTMKIDPYNECLINQLCYNYDENFKGLLLHQEVCWLSRDKCLAEFHQMLNAVLSYLEHQDVVLRNNLIKSVNDIAYLTDLSELFSNMNLKLQGDDMNLIKTKNVIAAFVSKLPLYKMNVRCQHNFPRVSSSISCLLEELNAYHHHLDNLHSDFIERYQDILKLDIPEWVLDPFSNVDTALSSELQEELIELKTNEELKIKFKNGYQEFWLQKSISQLFPGLWSIVQRFLIPFPSSGLVEHGFSAVTMLVTEKRTDLDISERGDLRLFLSEMKPDIDQLLKDYQLHPSL